MSINRITTVAFGGSLALATIVGMTLLGAAVAKAEPPDFSICDGLTGAAWGLCRGGAAAGCADAPGTEACANIEATIRDVTGTEPPWIEPPAVCPCDFAQIPLDEKSWTAKTAAFQCDKKVELARIVENYPTPSDTDTYLGVGTTSGAISCAMHLTKGDRWVVEEVPNLTKDQFFACFDDVVSYGTRLIDIFGKIIVIQDDCTPKLVP